MNKLMCCTHLVASIKFQKNLTKFVGLCCIESSGEPGPRTESSFSLRVQSGSEEDSYGFFNLGRVCCPEVSDQYKCMPKTIHISWQMSTVITAFISIPHGQPEYFVSQSLTKMKTRIRNQPRPFSNDGCQRKEQRKLFFHQ